MGVVAYKMVRQNSNTGDVLGDIIVYFPYVDERFEMLKGTYYSVSDLAKYPEFPLNSSIFCSDSTTADVVRSYGFNNALDITVYWGERWVLSNGSYIAIDKAVPPYSSNYSTDIYYYLANDTAVYSYSTPYLGAGGVNNRVTFDFLLCLWQKATWRMPRGEVWISGENTGKLSMLPANDAGDVYIPDTQAGVKSQLFFDGVEPIITPTNPYAPGGESGTGGGTGDFDGTGDDIAVPGLPTLSAVDGGFITLFNPSLAQLKNLSSYMWSNLFDVDGWKKIFADPMNAILGLSIVPVAVPAGGAQEVKVGNISTGITMTTAATQYVVVDCGTINVNEYWGAYLDYDPYTKAELYLPYVGTHPIATDDIMGKSVHIVYHVDILSGACCAYVSVNDTVLYSFLGQCSAAIPITGDSWVNVVNGVLSIAGSIGSMVATGGASAPMAATAIASTAVNTLKPSVEKSGAMSGAGGMLAVQTPYLILTRPRQAVPSNQNAYTGYPAFITQKLGDLTGYTEIDSIHLENIPATEGECVEIETLLKGGVIF